MPKNKNILFVLLFLLFSFTCQRINTQSDDIIILTSIFPIYDIARNIIQDKMKIDYFIPAGANPHNFNPTPSEVRKLQNVSLFIAVHPEFDGWITKYLNKKTRIVYLTGDHSEHVHHAHDHNQHTSEHSEENPHIWLSVKQGKAIAHTILYEMVQYDPQNRTYYESQLNEYKLQLNALQRSIKSTLSGLNNTKFIQYHPAWDYFADEYGLNIVETIEFGHGDEPSVKRFKEIVITARKSKVSTIVIGVNSKSTSTIALAKEINAQLIYLDTLGDPDNPEKSSYIKLIKFNAETLGEALKNENN